MYIDNNDENLNNNNKNENINNSENYCTKGLDI